MITRLLRACTLLSATVLLLPGCDRTPCLRVYTWLDYISPDVVERFERENGCKVVIDTFDSNETMYARLKAGEPNYDLVMPSSYIVELLAKEEMIVPLDHSKIPDVMRNFDPMFAPMILDSSFTYSAPYAVTFTGFCYSKTHLPVNTDINTWAVLSDPRFDGKITLLDDIREVIGAGLMSLGYSINSVNPAEIEAAVQRVLEWKRMASKFDSESYKNEVPSGATWIAQAYSTDSTQVILGDPKSEMAPRGDIGFALPREGFSIAFDEMVIPANACNPDLAYKFMNFLYSADVARANMEYIVGPCPVKPGIDALDPSFRSAILIDKDVLSAGQVIRAIDSTPGALELYNKAWDRILTAGAWRQ